MTLLCWKQFSLFFEERGYHCLAPSWPYKNMPIEKLRNHPAQELARLGVTEIVDHYARIIQALDKPPILIGHSFGGLFVQMLLDRGLGKAGVAINPAPPKGVLPLTWSTIKSNAGVLFKWMAWKRIVYLSFEEFQYAFVNTLPLAEQKIAYDTHVVPETGHIFFQAALAPLDSHGAVQVAFHNGERSPLLLIAGAQDHTVPD